MIYPSYSDKELYLARYKERNSPQSFIDLIDTNWFDWIEECEMCTDGCMQIKLVTGWTITDELNHMSRCDSVEL